MQILVCGTPEQCRELSGNLTGINWVFVEKNHHFTLREGIDAYFNLREDAYKMDYISFNKPVFINSVCVTIQQIKIKSDIVRINGWNGFLEKNIWEVAGNISEKAKEVLHTIQKEFVLLPDDPGFISARIISMIINEAYFAKSENVSTESEIDIAMKLGTNYPYGPFEWAKKIGLNNIYMLLQTLTNTDSRYTPNQQLALEAISSS